MKNKKDILYIFFTIIFYIGSIGIVIWIDRQEVDKEVEKRAEKICQKNASKNEDEKPEDKSLVGNISKDANASITSKKEASESFKNIDVLVNSVGEINLSN